jgi:transcriptional regulator with XRE-family HTH domain
MKISDWLKQKKITQQEFINSSKLQGLEISKGALQKWCNGQRIPRKEEMEKIYALTNKKVKPNDFYNLN